MYLVLYIYYYYHYYYYSYYYVMYIYILPKNEERVMTEFSNAVFVCV